MGLNEVAEDLGSSLQVGLNRHCLSVSENAQVKGNWVSRAKTSEYQYAFILYYLLASRQGSLINLYHRT